MAIRMLRQGARRLEGRSAVIATTKQRLRGDLGRLVEKRSRGLEGGPARLRARGPIEIERGHRPGLHCRICLILRGLGGLRRETLHVDSLGWHDTRHPVRLLARHARRGHHSHLLRLVRSAAGLRGLEDARRHHGHMQRNGRGHWHHAHRGWDGGDDHRLAISARGHRLGGHHLGVRRWYSLHVCIIHGGRHNHHYLAVGKDVRSHDVLLVEAAALREEVRWLASAGNDAICHCRHGHHMAPRLLKLSSLQAG
mmetsp:Transcript_42236/g.105205  ORF Transcript_42236/g.105205 Transcript_42236/m.105205 type:complete len:253 (-) Transcript_42236:561-1319(-)